MHMTKTSILHRCIHVHRHAHWRRRATCNQQPHSGSCRCTVLFLHRADGHVDQALLSRRLQLAQSQRVEGFLNVESSSRAVGAQGQLHVRRVVAHLLQRRSAGVWSSRAVKKGPAQRSGFLFWQPRSRFTVARRTRACAKENKKVLIVCEGYLLIDTQSSPTIAPIHLRTCRSIYPHAQLQLLQAWIVDERLSAQ